MDKVNRILTRNILWPTWPEIRAKLADVAFALCGADLPPYVIELVFDFVSPRYEVAGREHFRKIQVLQTIQKKKIRVQK